MIRNLTTGAVLAQRAVLATTFLQRAIGLLARRALPEGEALIIPRCQSVHTCFMRFSLDVLFVRSRAGTGEGVVVKCLERLKPFRLGWALPADTVMELPAGTLTRTSTQPGQMLAWD